jgi:hypothetical protein
MRRIFLPLLITLLLATQAVKSQPQVWITGYVSDDWGVPIENVFVYLANQMPHGTYTKPDGSYALSITSPTDTLICTHINYKQSIEIIKGNSFINFVLQRKMVQPTTLQIAASVNTLPIVNATTITNTTIAPTKKIKGKKSANTKPEEVVRSVVKKETAAYYIGGQQAYENYLSANLNITDSLATTAFAGTVKVTFFIGPDGKAKNITLLKGVQTKVNNLVLATINKMPAWAPATQNGLPTSEYKELEVAFDVKAKTQQVTKL